MAAKKEVKLKSKKEMKKELENRLFGEKNKTKKKEIMNMLKKLDFEIEKERKEKVKIEENKKKVVNQLLPIGVDPKTVMCINFQNKNCNLGEKCPFSHVPIKKIEIKAEIIETKKVCRFLIDAINTKEYKKEWKCPMDCKDIHQLKDVDNEIDISLEEYLEMQRQSINIENQTPVTKETFEIWRKKKDKEEKLHAKRVEALNNNTKGTDLFKKMPELFTDDDDAEEEINYKNRESEETSDSDE